MSPQQVSGVFSLSGDSRSTNASCDPKGAERRPWHAGLKQQNPDEKKSNPFLTVFRAKTPWPHVDLHPGTNTRADTMWPQLQTDLSRRKPDHPADCFLWCRWIFKSSVFMWMLTERQHLLPVWLCFVYRYLYSNKEQDPS